ncbi:MAG: ATP-binding protein [Eubacterium sp.]
MKKKISIRNKTIRYFSVLIITIIVAQMVFNFSLLKPLVSYTKTKVIENSFYELQKEYSGNIDDISVLAEEIQNKHGIKIVLSYNDEIIYTTGFSSRQEFIVPKDEWLLDQPPQDKRPENKGDDRYQDFVTNKNDFNETPTVDTIKLKNDAEQLVLKGKFNYNSEDIYVVMTLPMETIDTSVRLYNSFSSIIMLIALAIGILLAVGFSKSLTKPITSVEKVAQNLSNLDFSEIANENVSVKELESLARSINSMSENLKKSIEDLQIANEELKKDIDYKNQVELMRRQFIANVSHEMKTPLGLLQIYCENLKDNVEGVDKEYYCNVIIEETQNLNDMVVSMLEISSIESGLQKMNFIDFDLSSLCESIAEKFKNAYENHNLVYNIEKSITVNGDAKYISQAINNYIINAVSHTQEGKLIKFDLAKNNKCVVVSVFNEGNKIPDENIEKIWDPFFKSDKARTRNGQNNVGLGLYIVKTIIEKHEGQVNVVNKENGVEFSFTIPNK